MNPFAVSTGTDQRLLAQHAKLLGERGLGDTEFVLQLTPAGFTLRQPAEQQQSVWIGERFQQTTGGIGSVTKLGKVNRGGCGHIGQPMLEKVQTTTDTLLINILFVNIMFKD